MTALPLSVGLIGCGNIVDTYLGNAPLFANAFRIVAVADLDPAASARAAERHRFPATTPETLLADPDVDLILDLTIPVARVPVALAAVAAGKHVYLEKPLGASVSEGRMLLNAAAARGVQVGCAPDTCLGGAHQAARRLVADGAIGRVVGGRAAVMDDGMEACDPSPTVFFAPGGGPVAAMRLYYITALVSLLGRVERVLALSSTGVVSRAIGSDPRAGDAIAVAVPTTLNALLRFADDVDVMFTASRDAWTHRRSHLEIEGTEGRLILPEPNWFGGTLELSRRGHPFEVIEPEAPWGEPNRMLDDGERVADYRGLGLARMCEALIAGRAFEASGKRALHVLEIMEACIAS